MSIARDYTSFIVREGLAPSPMGHLPPGLLVPFRPPRHARGACLGIALGSGRAVSEARVVTASCETEAGGCPIWRAVN